MQEWRFKPMKESSTGNIAFSIGAAQANAIPANVNHFTTLLMPDGDAATDKFILQSQIGYRNPVGCYDVLCSYPYGYAIRETTHYGLIYNGDVPGTRFWTFNSNVPDAPINVSVVNPTTSSLQVNFTDVTWDETNVVMERKVGIFGIYAQVASFGVLNQGNSVGYWGSNNTGLASKTTYCFRLKTVNAVGSSPYSNESCSTTQ